MRALVIGGGFYGCRIAAYLVEKRGFREVLIVEQENQLMSRASYINQARVHNGYHYPRSFRTALRSRINLPHFVAEWGPSVQQDFQAVYGVAAEGSMVTPSQFKRFCDAINAVLEPAPQPVVDLFCPDKVSALFTVQEYGFNSRILRDLMLQRLKAAGVQLQLGARAERVQTSNEKVRVALVSQGQEEAWTGDYVFNCTYAGLNAALPKGDLPASLKHEVTELPLVRIPHVLKGLAITIMDGPFFSIMPFPDRQLTTLSHVRYTPHKQWRDNADVDPYRIISDHPRSSRYDFMRRDVLRFLPAFAEATYVDSLYEIKTVLTVNEGNDGRPILAHRSDNSARVISVLGGKIDNIYDILDRLDAIGLR